MAMCQTISEARRVLHRAPAVALAAAAGLALVVLADSAAAQQPTAPPPAARPARAQAIEIRGQVPTPQVVTVRPRQIPVFSREVLTPAYFDQHFREWLLAPYDLAPNLSAEILSAPTTVVPPTLPTDSTYRPSPAADSTRTSAPPRPAPSADSSAGAPPPSQPTSPTAPREK
jgi:hypothetical protein